MHENYKLNNYRNEVMISINVPNSIEDEKHSIWHLLYTCTYCGIYSITILKVNKMHLTVVKSRQWQSLKSMS